VAGEARGFVKTLVLGIGNILLGDEGIGVWVIESLRRCYQFPASTMVLEGGTLGLDLLPRLQNVSRLLVVDAVKLGGQAGEIVRLEGDEVPRAIDVKVSPHQIGLQELLATARLMGCEPPKVVLWGMEPERVEPGADFSPKVARALPLLQTSVLKELKRWGVRPKRLVGATPPPAWWQAAARRSS
jgi:hydrogenase maturation protease